MAISATWGLEPGTYTARPDTVQLQALQLTAWPQSLAFTIAPSEEGVIADGFEFVLRPLFERQDQRLGTTEPKLPVSKPSDTTKVHSPQKPIQRDTTVQNPLQPLDQQGNSKASRSATPGGTGSLNLPSALSKAPNKEGTMDTLHRRDKVAAVHPQRALKKNQKRGPAKRPGAFTIPAASLF